MTSIPNSRTYGSLLNPALETRSVISRSRSGADLKEELRNKLFVKLLPRCSFDHCRSLRVRQFLDASLAGYDVANFNGQVCVLLFLSYLKTWQEGVFENLN